MAILNTAAGTKLFIGSTTQHTTVNDFEGESWTEVEEVEDLGEFGDESNDVTFTALGDTRTRHLKGSRDAGTLQVVCGHRPDLTGQAAMVAAEAEPNDYAFKVVLNDKDTLSGTGTTYYFMAKVMSKRINAGNADNVVRINFNIGIQTAVLSVDAT